MKIGPYPIDNPLALAPMAGVTDKPFRQLCRRLGAGYVVTEMLTSNPALHHTRTSRIRGDFNREASPIAVQIAGSEPKRLSEAAIFNIKLGAQIIDINMGCPAKKVCNKLAGSALLSDPDQVRFILRAVVSACGDYAVPVTLKIRTGPDRQNRNGVTIAKMAEQAGVAALAVHGRTRMDRFKGQAEHETTRQICEAVSIPVFANGDISSPQQASMVLESTGAAGLMIGRGAQGNPWIFREIRHYFETGEELPPPSPGEVLTVVINHLRHLHQVYGEPEGVRVARKHINWYLTGSRGTATGNATTGAERAASFRKALMQAQSGQEQCDLLHALFNGHAWPEHGQVT